MQSERAVWCKATLGYDFKDEKLLKEALTHGSSGKKPTYERLEFLGDRVLGLVVAEMLHHAYPDSDEGDLGRRHAALVRGEMLVEIAEIWQVEPHIRALAGKIPAGVLSDVVESVLGAIYMEAGLVVVQAIIARFWADFVKVRDGRDAKTVLQELLQGKKLPVPVYSLVKSEGADHEKVFTIKVTCDLGTAEGVGVSKHAAGKVAAANLLKDIGESV